MLLRLVPLKQVGSVMVVCAWLLPAVPFSISRFIRSAGAEAIVEEAEASAQDRFGHGALLVPVKSVRESDARGPVAVVGNVVLRLPAQPAGEREVLVHLPIVLDKERGVEHVALKRLRPGGVGELGGQASACLIGGQAAAISLKLSPAATPFHVSTKAVTEGKVKLPLKFPLVVMASRSSRSQAPNLMACVPLVRVVKFCSS